MSNLAIRGHLPTRSAQKTSWKPMETTPVRFDDRSIKSNHISLTALKALTAQKINTYHPKFPKYILLMSNITIQHCNNCDLHRQFFAQFLFEPHVFHGCSPYQRSQQLPAQVVQDLNQRLRCITGVGPELMFRSA